MKTNNQTTRRKGGNLGTQASDLKKQARELYINEHQTAKAISQQIGVSEKSIGAWVKQYGWKENRDNPFKIKDAKVFVRDLKAYLTRENPSLYLLINDTLTDFLTDYRP